MKHKFHNIEISDFVVGVTRTLPTLTVRQLALLTLVYFDELHTTTSEYASILKVSRSVITRALQVLEKYELLIHTIDTKDNRKIIIKPTMTGSICLASEVFDNSNQVLNKK